MARPLAILAGVAIAAAIVAGGVALVLPRLVSSESVRHGIATEIAAWTGLDVEIRGPVRIGFLPKFSATLEDVASRDAIGPVSVRMPKLEATLELLPLLTGRISVVSMTADGAAIIFRPGAAGTMLPFQDAASIRPGVEQAKAAMSANPESPDLSFLTRDGPGVLSMRNSSVSVIWPDGREDRFSDAGGLVRWQNFGAAASAEATATWHGQPVTVSATIGSPILFAAGGTTPLDLAVSSAPLALTFKGEANLAANFFASGAFSLTSDSAGRALAWLNLPVDAAEPLGEVSLGAALVVADGKMRFDDLALKLDGNPASGTLELTPKDRRLEIGGTLAFGSIDLATVPQALSVGMTAGDHADSLAKGLALDLRLSAETATAGPLVLTDAAGTIRTEAGNARLDLGSASFASGTLTGSLELSGEGAGRVGSFRLQGRDIVPGQLQAPASGLPGFDAPIRFDAELTGPGANLTDLTGKGKGTLSVSAGQGTIRNFSAEQLVSKVGAGELFALTDVYSGLSPVKSAALEANLESGALIIDSAMMETGGQRFAVAGALSYASGGVALNGVASSLGDETGLSPFFIGGTWDRPFVTIVKDQ